MAIQLQSVEYISPDKKKMLQYGIYNLSTGSSIYSLYATNYDVHMGNGDVMNYNNVAGPEMDTKRY